MEKLVALSFPALSQDWQQCIASFLSNVYYGRSRSANTLKKYVQVLSHFFASGTPPEKMRRADVEAFIVTRFSGKGTVSAATRNNRLTVLSSFYSYASTFVLPDDTPLMAKPRPTVGILRGKVARTARGLSFDEMTRLFAVMPKNTVQGLRDRAIYLLYFWTARRREEIARLCWGDIYQGTILDEQGNRREGWLYHFIGKGAAGEIDTAELPLPAKQAIDTYLKASGRSVNIAADEPLFLAVGPPRGGGQPQLGTPLRSSTMARNLKRYAKKAGLDASQVHLHTLRHTAAQARYLALPDLLAVSRTLRHASPDTTRIYLEGMLGTSDSTALLLVGKFGRFS